MSNKGIFKWYVYMKDWFAICTMADFNIKLN